MPIGLKLDMGKKDQEYFFKANKRYESLSDNEKKSGLKGISQD